MFSRKHRRTLVLSLVISAGTLTLPPAEAAAGRSGAARNPGSAVQVDLSTRSFIEMMKNLWGMLKDAPPGNSPSQPGDPHMPQNREGSGMCPIGNPNPGRP
jgi:hypothetical protein